MTFLACRDRCHWCGNPSPLRGKNGLYPKGQTPRQCEHWRGNDRSIFLQSLFEYSVFQPFSQRRVPGEKRVQLNSRRSINQPPDFIRGKAAVCGKCYNKEYCDYICVDEIGNLIKPDYLTQAFPQFLESHGLRRIRFHDLRHSCASLLLANGVPMKQIQEWLGHSDFATTANVYAHLDYNSKLASANAMTTGLQAALNVIA